MVVQGAAGTVQLWFEVLGRVQRVLFWLAGLVLVGTSWYICLALFTWCVRSGQVGQGLVETHLAAAWWPTPYAHERGQYLVAAVKGGGTRSHLCRCSLGS